jgi:hypothetical protein
MPKVPETMMLRDSADLRQLVIGQEGPVPMLGNSQTGSFTMMKPPRQRLKDTNLFVMD